MLYFAQFFHGVVEDVVSVDGDEEVDESLDAEVAIVIEAFEQSAESFFHGFANADFLLIDGLDLHEFVLVLEVEEEGVVYEIELLRFGDVDLELFDGLEELGEEFAVEFFDG